MHLCFGQNFGKFHCVKAAFDLTWNGASSSAFDHLLNLALSIKDTCSL